MLLLYIFLFLISSILLYFSGQLVVGSLMRIARFLHWREFVVAFFIMSVATSLPNFFLGVSVALQKIPQLSLGDILGGNVVDLTLAIGLAALVAKKGIPAESRAIQATSIFTIAAAILPIIFIFDGTISRFDGVLLISFFFLYAIWLFSGKERFTKVYDGIENFSLIRELKNFFIDLIKIIIGVAILLLATQGIILSAKFFAQNFNLSLVMVGAVVVGLGNALPETYLSFLYAKKNETWMILGNLMGSVIVATTLVLGLVALISPIHISDVSAFAIAKIFTIISALFFFFSVRTEHKITKREGFLLVFTYVLFLVVEILIKK